jgi:hypothetical protein
VIVAAFAVAVAVGTGLLLLPIAREGPGSAPLLTALFTATSAVCVTGLIVVDTPVYWSAFGQVVILAMIQVGGFGIMTLASLVGLLISRRLGLRSRLVAAAETKHIGLRGIRLYHSRPYHPQTCGKVERFHQTQKKWLRAQPQAATLVGLQRQLNRFQTHYNTVRPHRALGRRTPAQAYQARPKAVPSGPIIPTHYRVRHDKIGRWGAVTVRHNSRLHYIGLGARPRRHPNQPAHRRPDIRVIHRHTGELIRELILDPAGTTNPAGCHPAHPNRGPRP